MYNIRISMYKYRNGDVCDTTRQNAMDGLLWRANIRKTNLIV